MHLPYKFKRLDFEVDARRIAEEMGAVGAERWVRHRAHDAGHRILPLVSSRGTLAHPDGSPNHALVLPFLPTPILDAMPHTRGVLERFGARPARVRLDVLDPGRTVSPHRDLDPAGYGTVRIHMPIVTNPGVRTHVWDVSHLLDPGDHEVRHMAAGEVWAVDIGRVHAVTNPSAEPRIHLVADLQPEGHLFDLLFRDCSADEIIACMSHPRPQGAAMDAETLGLLSGGDPDLGRRLWNVTVRERSPQESTYKYPARFWDKSAYERMKLSA